MHFLLAFTFCALAAAQINEPFNGTTLPSGWVVQAGGASVHDGVLTLSSACVQLPGTYNRSQGLTIEMDVTINNGGIGDFNTYTLYDTFKNDNCHAGPQNGYLAGWYPAGSDNPQDTLIRLTNGVGIPLAATPTRISYNNQYHLKQELLADGTINTYINGVKTMTANDNNRTTGFLTLRSWQGVDIDNVKVGIITPPGARTFVVTFTGRGGIPPTCNSTGECWRYPVGHLANSYGMTTVVRDIMRLPTAGPILTQAFTFYSGTNGSAFEEPRNEADHGEAEAWLRSNDFNGSGLDRLVIAGHSYGGNRARLFAAQVYRNFNGVRTESLILVDPIDWTSCDEGSFLFLGCVQTDVRHSAPVGVDRAIVFRQRRDALVKIWGYTLFDRSGVSTRPFLNHNHEEIDDAETVHQEIVSLAAAVNLARPTVALRVIGYAIQANISGVSVRFQVNVRLKNVGSTTATNLQLTSATSLGGVAPSSLPGSGANGVIEPQQEGIIGFAVQSALLQPGKIVPLSIRGVHNPETNGIAFGADFFRVTLPAVQ